MHRDNVRALCGDSYGLGCWLQVFFAYKNVPIEQAKDAYIAWLTEHPPCRHKTHARAKYRLAANALALS
jgi:hypothetical protein